MSDGGWWLDAERREPEPISLAHLEAMRSRMIERQRVVEVTTAYDPMDSEARLARLTARFALDERAYDVRGSS